MLKVNKYYADLKASYLFSNIRKKTEDYLEKNPGAHLYKMGIGDVSLPLCETVIEGLHKGVDAQADKATFHGYLPEQGDIELRKTIVEHYRKRNVCISDEEVFISSGAKDELADILDLFAQESSALVIEPAYPAYVDTNIMAGRKIYHLNSGKENGFLPLPDENTKGDIIYICSPNNPTGAVYNREQLKCWVDFANKNGSVIIFDAAYEAFIEEDLPHSIFEIEGAETCAIEICSLSKTAGFTGTRLGYTIMSKNLKCGETSLHSMWERNRSTKTNGVSYILQKGACSVFTDEGQKQTKANIAVYKANAKVLMEPLDKLGIWYCGGKNAPYIWMKCPNNMGSWEMFDRLLNEIQVVATPGEGFGSCGEGYIRFSTFGDPEDTKEAARRLLVFLKDLI